MLIGLIEIIRALTSKKVEKPELEECDCCGQISRLNEGLCIWCHNVYKANK